MLLNAHLSFDGRCEEAFKFYEKVLGGKILAMVAAEGTPVEAHFSPEWKKKIIHARLSVGDKLLMGSDTPPDRYQAAKGITVTLGLDTRAEAERAFNALAQKGAVQMPFQETFFAEGFGMLTDQFGTPWMVISEKKPG